MGRFWRWVHPSLAASPAVSCPLSSTRHSRVAKEVELQNLTDRLATYIDRKRNLETENSRLSIELMETRRLLEDMATDSVRGEIGSKRLWEENESELSSRYTRINSVVCKTLLHVQVEELRWTRVHIDNLHAALNCRVREFELYNIRERHGHEVAQEYQELMDVKVSLVLEIADQLLVGEEAFLNITPAASTASVQFRQQSLRTSTRTPPSRCNSSGAMSRKRSHSSLFKLPGVEKGSASGLWQLSDKANSHLRALSTMATTQEILDGVLFHLISSKLDHRNQERWMNESSLASDESVNIFAQSADAKYSASLVATVTQSITDYHPQFDLNPSEWKIP
ncbi:lamin Dm0-like [Drosophila eugracilis]|uniref:lamin Dm0-like n=1 Tax=Drosophila eugracilis TaxID=29029 RepID=UPI001BDA6334|nr:lamin Dm0-like [Drosophila eugracilis]